MVGVGEFFGWSKDSIAVRLVDSYNCLLSKVLGGFRVGKLREGALF